MAASTRSTMRILSPRLQCLRQPPSPAIQQVRCLSARYSNPSKRGFSAAPARPPTFLDASTGYGDEASGVRILRDPRVAEEERRQYHFRRMRYAGMGLLTSMAALGVIISNINLDDLEQSAKQKKGGLQMEASDESNAKFQGKEVHVIGAGDGKRIVAQGAGEEVELVETGTSSVPHFPKTIFLPTDPESKGASGAGPNAPANPGNIENQEEYTLVGLGIRTVMWIQVYVVGLYIRTKDITSLQSKLIHHVNPTASTLVPNEKEDLRKKLLDPAESREIWSKLLEVPGIKTAWRVSPTRNTDFGHLRDGFVTGINKRTQEARQLSQGKDTEYEAEDFGQSIRAFKGIFSGGKAPKGSILIMHRDRKGVLDVLYQPKPDGSGRQEMERLGSVPDERISRLIWLGYLAGDKVSSDATRKGVVNGCVGFAGRPVGSAETMIS
ncbi:Altered inheritance of mitochondria protein 18 mitochondrial [Vermiconidia calcicola]|uniref:Altered inheritance of mitochondria protein 18 mitochondrial n=1 Tax=Vermiconidia calcicola TaxID=1690605 RepID=A0ACC3MZD9_9PEZI|nr:Altered inheritance of mitochondria protein 18 mitochondrial [Vermiconidia calcicola]